MSHRVGLARRRRGHYELAPSNRAPGFARNRWNCRDPMSQADHDVQHLVLTRFNVRMPGMLSRPSRQWMDSRIDLFERHPARSFRSQTRADFSWLVFLDSDTSEEFRRRLSAISYQENGDPLFEAVYIDEEFTPQVASRIVASRARAGTLITTRVDNDDAVARDFIEVIRSASKSYTDGFINLVDGSQLGGGWVCRRPYTSNPFISLVEPVHPGRPVETVYVDQHDHLSAHGRISNLRTSHPMWMQIVHGGNIANELVGLRIRPSSLAPYFDQDLPVDPPWTKLRVAQIVDVVRIVLRLARKGDRVWELVKWLKAPR